MGGALYECGGWLWVNGINGGCVGSGILLNAGAALPYGIMLENWADDT